MKNGSWEHTVFFIGVRRHGNAPPIEKAMSNNSLMEFFLDYDEAKLAADTKSEYLGIRVEVFYAQLNIPFEQDVKAMETSLLGAFNVS